jgi:hypothetical protein
MKIKRGPRWLPAAVALWLGAAGTGMALLVSYSRTPGTAGTALERWPAHVDLPRATGASSLVVFLHPECPCSRATVAELARLLSKSQRPLEVTACFLRLSRRKSDPAESSLWRAARQIPGVKVVADKDGRIAKQFGAETSGTTALYDESGRLIFLGGITGSRGHEGDNAAEDVLTRLLRGESSSSNTRPHVYGCSIF